MEILILAASFVAGMILGGVYFGGLWWTVRRIAEVRRPGQMLVVSRLVRTAILLAGLFLVMQGDWKRMAAAFLGVLVVRGLIVRWLGPPERALKEVPYGNQSG